jgi:Ca-activated chloride channel family protein
MNVVALTFLAPERLWLLLVVAALAVVYVAVLRWRRKATIRFTEVDLLDEVAPRRPRWRRHVVAALQLAGLAAGVVAMARPIERSTERTESEGRILVLFDVSLSMMATDVSPDRLEAAKTAAREFVDQVADDIEVGLISFSGAVTLEVDPTLDREALDQGIDDLELSESTAIGDALATGTRLLERLASPRDDSFEDPATDDTDDTSGEADDDDVAPGAIVLLSDGETTVGRTTEEGGQIAADAGVPVFTIAFGTAEGTIEDPFTGEIVPVPVRPAPLQAVAEATGGAAYEAATSTELADAYDRIRESLGETLGEEIEIVTELTWRWAAAAFVLLAAAWALAMWWLRGLV